MLYTDLESLALAATQIDITDSEQIDRLRRLISVYWEAYQNPPYGIIGVGAITYAQDALIAAQLDTPRLTP
jgi:hypothetical protein